MFDPVLIITGNPILIIAVILSYLLGNLSPAILIGKLAGIDVRSQGSGNAGTTNVLRLLGKKAAIATLLIDILKGVIPVLLARHFVGQELAIICGIAAFVGHIWPVVFGFRGGKGVATALGVITAISPILGLIAAAIAIIGIAITKRVSVGSLAAAVALPAVAYALHPESWIWTLPMVIIVIIKHRMNIRRILKGEEPKLSLKKREEGHE